MSIFDRVDISKIVRKHIATLYNHNIYATNGKRKLPPSDLITFLFCPIIISAVLYVSGVRITSEYVNILITALSIFIGLLFGLLTMIFDLANKEKENLLNGSDENSYSESLSKKSARYNLTKEVFVNTSFAIVLSIITIIILFSTQFKPPRLVEWMHHKPWFPIFKEVIVISTNTLSLFLIIEFLLTLLMILKRFFLIYLSQFESKPTPPKAP